ncbi:Rv3235 family protein [Paenarthrobacter sp. PH39-S1]|uniref:Rv3235 family protein n=1 Tax=Micrococcaceae TaxID=1268 RepID=UPI0024B94FB0|nr:Rv3235 family protein [Paenarthrobacter sp. PH39-S1]MDJ0356445.1 Rv3235 family protein [Paenarthrobacter sp. PH39-S1]
MNTHAALDGAVTPIRSRPAPVLEPAGELAPVIPMPPRHRGLRAGTTSGQAATAAEVLAVPALGVFTSADREAVEPGGSADGDGSSLKSPADKFRHDLAQARAAEAALVRAMTAKIGQAAVEVLAGSRPPQQLARWLDARSFEALQIRAELTRSVQRNLDHSGGHSNVHQLHRNPSVRSVHCCAVRPGVYEASLVIAEQQHVRALAMRMEERNGVWKVTALEIG